jgi:hypothetical protein
MTKWDFVTATKENQKMRLKHAMLMGVITLASTMATLSFNLWVQPPEAQASTLQEEKSFSESLSRRFQRFESNPSLNFSRASSVVAIPTLENPVREIKELEPQIVEERGPRRIPKERKPGQIPIDPQGVFRQAESRWITIGGLYVPAGSPRLRLEPGAYLVQLSKNLSGWVARFIDEKGQVRGEAAADVRPARPVSVPSATVEHSVCYRFDSTVVCV